MRYSTTITIGVMSLIVAACGPGVAEPTPVPVVLNAEVCTEGEARDIRVYVRNLEDFEWRDVSVSLAKTGETYVREQVSLSPESQQAAEPFTDSREFSFRQAIEHETMTNNDQEIIVRLHNFSGLESAAIEVGAPQPGEWAGEVHPCQ